MTREEAIKFGKRVLSLSLFDETHEFCEIAIKALEQESILDKIRAEIEVNKKGFPPSSDYYKAINRALVILDKYKRESEVQNADSN